MALTEIVSLSMCCDMLHDYPYKQVHPKSKPENKKQEDNSLISLSKSTILLLSKEENFKFKE